MIEDNISEGRSDSESSDEDYDVYNIYFDIQLYLQVDEFY